MEVSFQVFEKVYSCKSTMEISSQGLKKFFKNDGFYWACQFVYRCFW